MAREINTTTNTEIIILIIIVLIGAVYIPAGLVLLVLYAIATDKRDNTDTGEEDV